MDMARQESGVLMSFQQLVKGGLKKKCEEKNEKWVWENYKHDKWRKKRQKPYVLVDSSYGHESLISIRHTVVSYLVHSYVMLCSPVSAGGLESSPQWTEMITSEALVYMTVISLLIICKIYLHVCIHDKLLCVYSSVAVKPIVPAYLEAMFVSALHCLNA